jgi:hypothetical protein
MITSKEIAANCRFTFCSICGSPAMNQDDEFGDESYTICPCCKSDHALVMGPELPNKADFVKAPVFYIAKEKPFNREEWEKKKEEKETAEDARLASYQADAERMGEPFARVKFLGIPMKLSQPIQMPVNPLLAHLINK